MTEKTNQHGGPRPKVRDDDTRGGGIPATRPDDGRRRNRHGSPGRKPKQISLRVGDVYTMHVFAPDGESTSAEMRLRVAKIERDYAELIDELTNLVYRISKHN